MTPLKQLKPGRTTAMELKVEPDSTMEGACPASHFMI